MNTDAFGYIRVSGRGQVDGDGFPRQRVAVLKYASDNGITITRWFEERAVPGATEWDNRPAWVDMVQEFNGVRTIVIERLDRLARDLMVQEHIIADLARRNIVLVSTLEPDLGSTEPTRVLMRQIMGAIAQYDKTMIVQKLRGARQRMKARGERCEGRKPYGHYGNELGVLANIQDAARAGETSAAIARSLNAGGVRTRSGGDWHPYTIGRILARTDSTRGKAAR